MTIRQNTLPSQDNDKERALCSMEKSVLALLWHCADMPDNQERHAFVLGNLIVDVNIGRMVPVKIISHLSICQKLSRIYLCQYF